MQDKTHCSPFQREIQFLETNRIKINFIDGKFEFKHFYNRNTYIRVVQFESNKYALGRYCKGIGSPESAVNK